jgi:PAS domain S-box-containing protein
METSGSARRPWRAGSTARIFVAILAILVLGKGTVTGLLRLWGLRSAWTAAVDPALMTLLCTPLLIRFVLAPIRVALQERESAKEALLASGRAYKTVMDNLPQRVFVKDRHSRYIFCNANYARDLGIEPDEIAGKSDRDFYPDDLADKYRADDSRVVESGRMEEIDERYLEAGKERFVHTVKTPVRDERGVVTGVLGIFWDVTEQRRAEEAVRESEERYRVVFEGASEGILVADLGTRGFLYPNPAICRMLGYTEQELTAMSVSDIHPKDALEGVISEFEAQARGEKTLSADIPCLRKGGKTMYADISTTVVSLDGRACNVGFFTDVTDRRQAEEALRDSERQYRLLAENATDVIWTMDLDLRFTYVSPSVAQLLGYDPDDAVSLSLEDLLEPESLALAMETFSRELAAEGEQGSDPGKTHTIELQLMRKDGAKVWTESRIAFVRDQEGRPTGIQGVSRDITARKRAQEVLRESEERYRALFESAAEGILVADNDTRGFLYANPAACRMLGYSEEELTRMGVADLHPEDALEHAMSGFEALARGEKTLVANVHCLRKDGRRIYADISSALVSLEGRQCTVGFFTDVTRRKKAEEEMGRAKELAEEALAAAEAQRETAEMRLAEATESKRRLEVLTSDVVERERRMLELKREVNDLLSAAGKEPKYKAPQQVRAMLQERREAV